MNGTRRPPLSPRSANPRAADRRPLRRLCRRSFCGAGNADSARLASRSGGSRESEARSQGGDHAAHRRSTATDCPLYGVPSPSGTGCNNTSRLSGKAKSRTKHRVVTTGIMVRSRQSLVRSASRSAPSQCGRALHPRPVACRSEATTSPRRREHPDLAWPGIAQG